MPEGIFGAAVSAVQRIARLLAPPRLAAPARGVAE
jgi:hypothetical protein